MFRASTHYSIFSCLLQEVFGRTYMTSVYDHRALNLLGFIAEVKVGGHFMQPIALEEALSADVWPLSSLLPFETLRAHVCSRWRAIAPLTM